MTRTKSSFIRVLLVTPLPPPSGGIGRWAQLLLNWCSLQRGPHFRTVDISPRWRHVEDLRLAKRIVGGGIQGIRDLIRVLVGLVLWRPNVVHVNSSAQLRGVWDSLIMLICWTLRIPSLYHIHMGRMPEVLRSRGFEWYGMRLALKSATRVIVLDAKSEAALKPVLRVGQVIRLPNAIDSKATPIKEHRNGGVRTILYLGHVIPTKGLGELARAWVIAHTIGWRLRVVGLGNMNYVDELRALTGSSPVIEFVGDVSCSGAWREAQACDIFVLPSHTEGFPNVILEAMTAGKAIISTRVGAIPEILDADTDEPCGLVVEPRDVVALSSALKTLISDPERRAVLGERARAKVGRCYSTDVVFAQLVGLWTSMAWSLAGSSGTNPQTNDALGK